MLLTPSLQLSRRVLPAHADDNRLFALMNLTAQAAPAEGPEPSGSGARPSLGVLFVVDTSGSMSMLRLSQTEAEFGTAGRPPAGESRLDAVIEAITRLIDSGQLRPDDRLGLVSFNSEATTLIGFTSPAERQALAGAVQELRRRAGGTLMGKGMEHALGVLGTSGAAHERMVLLTDGNTFDEPLVQEVAGRLVDAGVSVTCIGLGTDWNTKLLSEIADQTHGRPFHIVDDAQYAGDAQLSEPVSGFADLLASEFARAAAEAVTDVRAFVGAVRDVQLMRVDQVEPQMTAIALDGAGIRLGNVGGPEGALYVLEFTVGSRPPCRARLAQVGLTYRTAGIDAVAEAGPVEVIVEFSADDGAAGMVDQTVMNYVARRNVGSMMAEAAALSGSEPEKATDILRRAAGVTQRLNDPMLTVVLQGAIGQLQSNKTLSPEAVKTLMVGGRTKTIRGKGLAGMSDEEIRKMTGT